MTTGMLETIRSTTGHASNGGRMVGVDGRELPLKGAAVRARAQGGLARVMLKQLFANPHDEPLNVIYTMPLPADGAVSGYEFRIGDRRVFGKVETRKRAREQFEQAQVEGRTAGLLDEERPNVFTQQIGNVPPGQEVAVELTIDHKLAWLAEGLWEWRFPTVAAPRYLGAEGRVKDASAVTVDVGERPTGVRATLDLAVADLLADGRAVESPSHSITTRKKGAATDVTLAAETGAALDRDIVVRWAVPRPRPGVGLQAARPRGEHAYGLLTIVPPEAPEATLPRDLIVLIDTSGSMMGRPLDRAKRVVRSLIDSLRDEDRLEMIEFSTEARRWRSAAVAMTPEARREAHTWVEALDAGGGTEMLDAVEEALRPLRAEAQRQVLLVTDGHIGFETNVVAAVRDRLPAGSRLHTAGVGPATNRALLQPAARAGRGVEVQVGLDEDAERGASRLIAATRMPVITELEISGEAVTGTAPRRLPDLMAGSPVLASVRLRPEGGAVIVRGRTATGPWEERLAAPAIENLAGDPAITALYGRESVEDREIDLAAGDDGREIDAAVERLGLEFSIATRLTSWVAISEEVDVDPRKPVRRTRIPQELPYGMSAEGLGLRPFGLGMAHDMMLRACYAPDDFIQENRSAPPRRTTPRARLGQFFSCIPSPPLGEVRGPQPPARAGIFGRWISTGSEDVQVLEFEVMAAAALDWHPALKATIELRDGTKRTVEVNDRLTTISGPVERGRLVRLALNLERVARNDVTAVVIESDGQEIRIEL